MDVDRHVERLGAGEQRFVGRMIEVTTPSGSLDERALEAEVAHRQVYPQAYGDCFFLIGATLCAHRGGGLLPARLPSSARESQSGSRDGRQSIQRSTDKCLDGVLIHLPQTGELQSAGKDFLATVMKKPVKLAQQPRAKACGGLCRCDRLDRDAPLAAELLESLKLLGGRWIAQPDDQHGKAARRTAAGEEIEGLEAEWVQSPAVPGKREDEHEPRRGARVVRIKDEPGSRKWIHPAISLDAGMMEIATMAMNDCVLRMSWI